MVNPKPRSTPSRPACAPISKPARYSHCADHATRALIDNIIYGPYQASANPPRLRSSHRARCAKDTAQVVMDRPPMNQVPMPPQHPALQYSNPPPLRNPPPQVFGSFAPDASPVSNSYAQQLYADDPNSYSQDDPTGDSEQGDAKRRRIARVSWMGKCGRTELTGGLGVRYVPQEEDQV